MHTIFLALGSNVGKREVYIKKALALLEKKIAILSIGGLYKTKPMYYEDQNTFINTALKGKTMLSVKELLYYVKEIEQKIGRKKRFQNGPREIDIDIIFFDDVIYKDEALQIPHKRLTERDFVLAPLNDIAADAIHPILHTSIKELYTAIPQSLRTVEKKLP